MIWAEPVPTYKILSRDCRSDNTKEFIGIVREGYDGLQMSLYKFNKKKTKLLWDRAISIDILKDKIISGGSTSLYELQEGENNV